MNPRQDFLPFQPRKLISLLDMIPHANRFLAFWISANSFLGTAQEVVMQHGPGARADEKYRKDLTDFLIPLKNDCEKLQMKSIVDRIDHFLIKLIAPLLYTLTSARKPRTHRARFDEDNRADFISRF
jgi:hypothetical protein